MLFISCRCALLGSVVAVGLVVAAGACGPQKAESKTPIGVSRFDQTDGIDDDSGLGGGEASASGGAATTGGSSATGGQIAFILPDPALEAARREAVARAKEEAFARSLLARTATPEGTSGLVFVLGQRASDLPWVLAIENRGDKKLAVAGDPHLLSFELIGEPEAEPVAEPAPKPGKKAAPAKPKPKPKPVICGPTTPPKSVAEDNWLELAPGELVSYSFDPRALCAQAGVLTQGLKIAPRYGFAVETRKVWTKGKMTEELLTDKAPFVARRFVAEPEAPVLPKQLLAETFELDETYPLEAVQAQVPAPAAPGDAAAGSEGDAATAAAGDTTIKKPPPVLSLTVSPLGSTEEVDETTVTFTLKNVSKKSVELFLRRELVVYELLGPRGASTCRMYPAARAPDRTSFEALGSGASRSLTTRLAEACAPTTFAMPGTYAVSARFEARDSGNEHGYAAFTGDVPTERPARFVVRGTKVDPAQSGFHVAKKP